VEKSASIEPLKPQDATSCPRPREIRTPVQSLAVHSGAVRATGSAPFGAKSTLLEALTLDLRFPQGSNINSADESCGKLKATRFGRFFLRQDEVFPRHRCGSRLRGINS
jgi:hypothetical protein